MNAPPPAGNYYAATRPAGLSVGETRRRTSSLFRAGPRRAAANL
jgi:hypothetical protein